MSKLRGGYFAEAVSHSMIRRVYLSSANDAVYLGLNAVWVSTRLHGLRNVLFDPIFFLRPFFYMERSL